MGERRFSNSTPSARRPSIFISYSHDDMSAAKQLYDHLHEFRYQHHHGVFFDCEWIKAGDQWNREIQSALSQTDVYLVLISKAFFNSTFCFNRELPEICRRYREGEAKIFPLLVSDCKWDSYTVEEVRLSALEAVGPFDDKKRLMPLLRLDESLRDAALTRVVQRIYEHFGIGQAQPEFSCRQSKPRPAKAEIDPVTQVALIDKTDSLLIARQKIDQALGSGEKIIPLVAHGSTQDWHQALAIGLTREVCGAEASTRNRTSVDWAPKARGLSQQDRRQSLWKNLARTLLIESIGMTAETLHDAILDKLNSCPKPCIFHYELYAEQAARSDRKLIEEWLTDWRALGRSIDKGFVIVLLSLIYQSPHGSLLEKLGRWRQRRRIESIYASLEHYGLGALQQVETRHVTDWGGQVIDKLGLDPAKKAKIKAKAHGCFEDCVELPHGILKDHLMKDTEFLEVFLQ